MTPRESSLSPLERSVEAAVLKAFALPISICRRGERLPAGHDVLGVAYIMLGVTVGVLMVFGVIALAVWTVSHV